MSSFPWFCYLESFANGLLALQVTTWEGAEKEEAQQRKVLSKEEQAITGELRVSGFDGPAWFGRDDYFMQVSQAMPTPVYRRK